MKKADFAMHIKFLLRVLPKINEMMYTWKRKCTLAVLDVLHDPAKIKWDREPSHFQHQKIFLIHTLIRCVCYVWKTAQIHAGTSSTLAMHIANCIFTSVQKNVNWAHSRKQNFRANWNFSFETIEAKNGTFDMGFSRALQNISYLISNFIFSRANLTE